MSLADTTADEHRNKLRFGGIVRKGAKNFAIEPGSTDDKAVTVACNSICVSPLDRDQERCGTRCGTYFLAVSLAIVSQGRVGRGTVTE
jgi:hypothetical protein